MHPLRKLFASGVVLIFDINAQTGLDLHRNSGQLFERVFHSSYLWMYLFDEMYSFLKIFSLFPEPAGWFETDGSIWKHLADRPPRDAVLQTSNQATQRRSEGKRSSTLEFFGFLRPTGRLGEKRHWDVLWWDLSFFDFIFVAYNFGVCCLVK